ncbi:hypothetical protein [Lacinutrix sp. MEBiC02404]
MKKILLGAFLACMLGANFSCKKASEKKEDTKEIILEETVEKSVFKVVLDVIINNDEKFQMYYLEYGDTKWNQKKRIPKLVKGNTQPQLVEFNIPEKIFPSKLLFDFGENKTEENITINSVSLSYEDFKLNLTPQEFYAFFTPNKYIKYNKETGVMNCISVDGKYDPHFKSRPVFDKKLELEER